MDRDGLMERIQNRSVIILDVRPAEEYCAGNINGALSVPLADLRLMLTQLPKDQEIVAYCRGPYCVLSVQAVELLIEKGFNAVSIEEGVYDWQALVFTNRSITPKESTWEDIAVQAKAGNYQVITTDELWEKFQKDSDSLLLVDIRQAWEYRTGHIKGAVNFSMEPTWLARWQKKGELKTFLGADKDQTLIFY